MAKLPITLTCSDYARVMLLRIRRDQGRWDRPIPRYQQTRSWTDRQEMMRRAMHDPAVHGGEASMAGQLRRIEQGDRSYIALPIFVLRNFVARDLYVRNDGAIKGPGDLAGRHRHVQLGRERFHLVPTFPALGRRRFRNDRMVDRRRRHAQRLGARGDAASRRACAGLRAGSLGHAARRRDRCDHEPAEAEALPSSEWPHRSPVS